MEPKGTSKINLGYVHGYNGSKCGYCENQKGSITMGFSADHLSLRDYQDMMDRGWRRCGTYYYKPDVPNGCCKLFTIRMEAANYQMRKSHKKVMKKWNRFLAGEDLKPGKEEEEKETEDKPKDHPATAAGNENKIKKEETPSDDEAAIMKALRDFLDFIKTNSARLSQMLGWQESEILQVSEKTEKEMKVLKANAKKFGDYTTNLLMLLFADNRARLGQGGVKNVSDFIGKIRDLASETLSPLVGNMNVNIQDNGYIGFALNRQNAGVITESSVKKSMEEEVVEKKASKGDMNIEQEETKGEERKKKEKVRKDLTAKIIEEEPVTKQGRKFEIRFERARFDKESFGMYQRYCKDIHEKQKEDEDGYTNFLCMQGLEVDRMESGGKVLQLGCYHMKYYIDGKLIAIGVVDLTPKCLSSVYFFYEPEYKYLSLGVVGAVKEIEYIQDMQKYFPEFKYYYLGYYIQDCQKMVYKGEYEPAELLCPHTYNWVIMDEEIRKKIDKRETRLSGKNAQVPADLDFSATNLEKFVKDKIKLDINGPVKIIQLNKQYQDYYIKAFKDLATGLGRRLTTEFVFGYNK